jgi:hypothetical protein
VNSGRTRTNRPDHRHKSCTWKPLLDLVLTTLLKMFIELLEDSSQWIRCADRRSWPLVKMKKKWSERTNQSIQIPGLLIAASALELSVYLENYLR